MTARWYVVPPPADEIRAAIRSWAGRLAQDWAERIVQDCMQLRDREQAQNIVYELEAHGLAAELVEVPS